MPCNCTGTDPKDLLWVKQKSTSSWRKRENRICSFLSKHLLLLALSNSYLNVASGILSPCVIVSAIPCQSKTLSIHTSSEHTPLSHPGDRRSWHVLRWWHWTSKGKGSWMKQPPSRNTAGSHRCGEQPHLYTCSYPSGVWIQLLSCQWMYTFPWKAKVCITFRIIIFLKCILESSQP